MKAKKRSPATSKASSRKRPVAASASKKGAPVLRRPAASSTVQKKAHSKPMASALPADVLLSDILPICLKSFETMLNNHGSVSSAERRAIVAEALLAEAEKQSSPQAKASEAEKRALAAEDRVSHLEGQVAALGRQVAMHIQAERRIRDAERRAAHAEGAIAELRPIHDNFMAWVMGGSDKDDDATLSIEEPECSQKALEAGAPESPDHSPGEGPEPMAIKHQRVISPSHLSKSLQVFTPPPKPSRSSECEISEAHEKHYEKPSRESSDEHLMTFMTAVAEAFRDNKSTEMSKTELFERVCKLSGADRSRSMFESRLDALDALNKVAVVDDFVFSVGS